MRMEKNNGAGGEGLANSMANSFDDFWGLPTSIGAYKKLCTIASPLHLLTSANMRFSWTPQVEKTFQTLKELFTSAPVLTLPDPRL